MSPILLMAPPQNGGQGGPGSIVVTLLPIVLIFGIFYFLVIRPQSKRQKDLAHMIESLKQGDRVLTSGGLFGTVMSIKENVAVLKIADQVKVEVAKTAITSVVTRGREA